MKLMSETLFAVLVTFSDFALPLAHCVEFRAVDKNGALGTHVMALDVRILGFVVGHNLTYA